MLRFLCLRVFLHLRHSRILPTLLSDKVGPADRIRVLCRWQSRVHTNRCIYILGYHRVETRKSERSRWRTRTSKRDSRSMDRRTIREAA
jgi:hypothetical protein